MMSNEVSERTAVTDRVLDALRDGYRRSVLAHLHERNRPVDVDRLSERISRADDDFTSTAVDLHHVHLPKLADAGLVEYDPGEKTVDLALDESLAGTVLDLVEEPSLA